MAAKATDNFLGLPVALWVPFISAVVGGLGLKAFEWLLARPSRNAEARRDLNAEVNDLVARLDKVELELEEWRTRYFREQEKAAILRLQVIGAGLVPADQMTINLNTGEVEA